MTIELFTTRKLATFEREQIIKELGPRWRSKVSMPILVQFTGDVSPGHCGLRYITNRQGKQRNFQPGDKVWSISGLSPKDLKTCGLRKVGR